MGTKGSRARKPANGRGGSKGQDTDFRVRSSFERELEPGAPLFDEGDPGEKLYIIRAGEIELTREGGAGHRVVARLGPGDFFGELSVMLGTRCSSRAVAVKHTRVLELDRDTLEGMCLEQPTIAIRMLRVLVGRLIEAERRLAVLGVDDLLRPVVRGLVRRAEPSEGGARIPTTLRKLADDAGLSMFEAHRALHQLFDRKLVRLTDDCLIAPDLDKLQACLDSPDT